MYKNSEPIAEKKMEIMIGKLGLKSRSIPQTRGAKPLANATEELTNWGEVLPWNINIINLKFVEIWWSLLQLLCCA